MNKNTKIVILVSIVGIIIASIIGVIQIMQRSGAGQLVYTNGQMGNVVSGFENNGAMSTGQTGGFSANITGGIVTIDVSNTEEEIARFEYYQGSIFDLSEEVSKGRNSIDKEELFEKYKGLKMRSEGYIEDVREGYRRDYPYTVTVYMEDFASSLGSLTSIYCNFSEEWGKTLRTMDYENKVFFEGTMADFRVGLFIERIGSYLGSSLTLKDCELLE